MQKTKNRIYLLIILIFIIAICIGGFILFTKGRPNRSSANSSAKKQVESTVESTAGTPNT